MNSKNTFKYWIAVKYTPVDLFKHADVRKNIRSFSVKDVN